MRTVRFGKRAFETELIIFDKDGTLTDFRKTWVPLLEKRIEIILNDLGMESKQKGLKEEIYRAFGINGESIDPYGPFIYTSRREDEIIFTSVLYRFGVPWQQAKDLSHSSIDKAETLIDRRKITQFFDGVAETLNKLHKRGISIAMATADISHIAIDILKHAGIYELFDLVLGHDMVEKDKPHPEMILKIISRLNVKKEHVAYVGDTINDMEMGRKANIGLVVGVLESGIASKKDLEQQADVVIDSVREIDATD